MKKLFLIPLLTLFCSVMAWGATVPVASTAQLTSALSNADADVIELTQSLSLTGSASTSFSVTRPVTIDLGGNTITSANTGANRIFFISAAATGVTIKNGTLKRTANRYSSYAGNQPSYTIWVAGGNVNLQDLNIETTASLSRGVYIGGGETTISDCTISGYVYGLCPTTNGITNIEDGTVITGGTSGIYHAGGTVNVNGGTITGTDVAGIVTVDKAILNVNGGTISGKFYGISGNGSSGHGDTKITITGGSIEGTNNNAAGIYHPQTGQLVIKGNPIITGYNGIQLCSGSGMTGNITGGRIEATGVNNSANKSGDGFIPDGSALSIVEREGYVGTPSFAVNGGVFLSQQSKALLAYKWANNTQSVWDEAADYLSVTEGIFSSNPESFVSESEYQINEITSHPYGSEYEKLYEVVKNFTTTHDFTDESEVEYVELIADQTLSADQSAKYVEITENNTLTVAAGNTLNIGNGGLVLSGEASKLVVKPGAVVTVGTNGIKNNFDEDNLVLEATGSDEAGILLISPDALSGSKPLATVTIHTAARQKSANPYNYIWEYFACPVQEITDANKPTNNFDAAVQGLYAGEDHFITGVYTWGGNDWALVSSWKSLVPFKGYQLTNNSANGGVDYTFKGNLMGNGDGTYEFTTNGYGYFGNSYTAPIVISNFLGALDNSVYERTVWLYDAGADTYVSVNPLAARLGSAKYKDGTSIKEIRSLQAFILNKKADGAAATVNYRDAIWNNPRINSLAAPAPARYAAEEMQWSNIYVAANGKKEMVTLIEGADFSNEFDNGADAGKYINNNSMNLYAATNDGKQAIVATDNLENTILSFQAGDATEYTLSFENGNENYMLRDNVTGAMVAIAEGAEYTFTQAANTTNPARFEVVAIAKVPTAIENVEEAAKATGIYTLAGQYMGRDFTVLPAGVYVVNGVKVVK